MAESVRETDQMKLSVVTPLWQDRPASENIEVATNADRLGFPELWIGEMATFDAFAFATAGDPGGLRTLEIMSKIQHRLAGNCFNQPMNGRI